MQVTSSPQPFDVVIVGSGATGGWAAKKLTEAGMRVVLLEAGAKITPKDFTEHTQTWQMPFLGYSPEIKKTRPIQGLCYACRETNYKWFVNDLENPLDRVIERCQRGAPSDYLRRSDRLQGYAKRHYTAVSLVTITPVDAEVSGVRCIGLNKVAMPGNLVAIEMEPGKRDWSLLSEYAQMRIRDSNAPPLAGWCPELRIIPLLRIMHLKEPDHDHYCRPCRSD